MIVGVCDDIREDRAQLANTVCEYCAEKNIDVRIMEYGSGEELLDSWTPGALQIIFMDVYMGGMSGIQAARKLREADNDCAIIFTTTSADHAIDSYGVRASDYLQKPFGAREVGEALDWCLTTMAESLRTLEVISDRERRSIRLLDIEYIEVYGRISVIHTKSGEVNTNRPLSELEAQLEDKDFLRCHRSYLVNMNHILKPTTGGFLMTCGDKVPVTADFATQTRQAFFDWTFERTWKKR